jgi:hypothetical protein
MYQTRKVYVEEATLPTRNPELPRCVSPVPPTRLEPLELDLAVAQAKDFEMDVVFDFDFNPVDSAEGKYPSATSGSVAPEKLNPDHEAFEAGIVLQSSEKNSESKIADRPKHSSLKKVISPKACEVKQVYIYD